MGARSVVMTGAEYIEFAGKPWGDGLYWDDTLFDLNGLETDDIDPSKVNPDDMIVLKCGSILSERDDRVCFDAVYYFLKWRKAKTHMFVTVEVDKDRLSDLKGFLKRSCSGRVVERASELTEPRPG